MWDAFAPAVAWLGNTGFATWLGMSTMRIAWLFSFHLMGLTLLLGSVLVTGLNLLGLFLRARSAAQVRRDVRPVYRLGLIVALVTGALIFTGGAVDYYQGYWLRLKLVLLAVALVFQATVYRTVSLAPDGRFPRGVNQATGACLLGLWFGVAWAGRAIAFF